MREHRCNPAGDVGGVRPPIGLLLQAAPGRTWAATSAMWIQRRTPRSVLEAETASSKSWALAGSTVKVGRSRRSRLSTSRAAAAGRGLAASSSIRRENPTRICRSSSIASSTSAASRGSPSWRTTRARPRPWPSSTSAMRPGVAARRPPPSSIWPPRSKSSSPTRNRPALGDEDHPPLTCRRSGTQSCWSSTWRALLAPLVRLGRGVVLRLHLGRDPDAVDRSPITGQILPHRQIERAAIVQRDDLLEGALAEGGGPHHLRDPRLLQRRRDDLRGGGGVPVDQDDHRVARQRVPRRLEGPGALGAAVRRDDLTVGHEDAGDQHRLREQARRRCRADRAPAPGRPASRGSRPPCGARRGRQGRTRPGGRSPA